MMWRFFESGLFEIFFSITFLIIMGMIVFGLISSVRQWSKNNSSPRLTVEAQAVAKRLSVSHHAGTDQDRKSVV